MNIIPAKIIKGQVVADFLTELTPTPTIRKEEWWIIHVDGSANSIVYGAGVVIQMPTNENIDMQ